MLIHSGCISVLWTSQVGAGPECLDATSTETHPIVHAVSRIVRRTGRIVTLPNHKGQRREPAADDLRLDTLVERLASVRWTTLDIFLDSPRRRQRLLKR